MSARFVVVPVEPTEAMKNAAKHEAGNWDNGDGYSLRLPYDTANTIVAAAFAAAARPGGGT